MTRHERDRQRQSRRIFAYPERADHDDSDDHDHDDSAPAATPAGQHAGLPHGRIGRRIFDFGGAGFYGSTGSIVLNKPIVGMTTDEATGGYWFVASDGGIFGFKAPFYGSAGGTPLTAPVVAMAGTVDGRGYWLATANGAVFAYGDAPDFGSVHPGAPVVGIADTADGHGYWLTDAKGDVYPFGDARNFGSTSGTASSNRSSGSPPITRPAGTGWSRPMAASSASTPPSSDRRVRSSSTSRSSASPQPPTGRAIRWLPTTAGSSASATPGSRGRWAAKLNQPMVGMSASRSCRARPRHR